uniref:Zinc finger, CCHC-type, retrotransposon Gag domain protein n=1 Tax=Tanacetum cinerariifolium TaxID=118510 RepID=A0A6L2N0E2_TANCI|nr:hypothetical protein [Tanacetum cinerariifolium]
MQDYPAFTAAVAQAVADLLPTLTARITNEIHQNENNENNGNRRNTRRVNTEGSGNYGNAQPTDIHVWLERFQKQKPQTFSSASTPVEAENWIAHIEKIFEVLGCGDQFKARLATYKLEVPKVDDVSLVDGVFDGAFGGDEKEDFVMGEGLVLSSSSLERSTMSCLGGIMVSLIFLEGLEEEACVDAMEVEEK